MKERMIKLVTRVWNSKDWMVKTVLTTTMILVVIVLYIVYNIYC